MRSFFKDVCVAIAFFIIILAGGIVLSEPSTNKNEISSYSQRIESKEVITVEMVGR